MSICLGSMQRKLAHRGLREGADRGMIDVSETGTINSGLGWESMFLLAGAAAS